MAVCGRGMLHTWISCEDLVAGGCMLRACAPITARACLGAQGADNGLRDPTVLLRAGDGGTAQQRKPAPTATPALLRVSQALVLTFSALMQAMPSRERQPPRACRRDAPCCAMASSSCGCRSGGEPDGDWSRRGKSDLLLTAAAAFVALRKGASRARGTQCVAGDVRASPRAGGATGAAAVGFSWQRIANWAGARPL